MSILDFVRAEIGRCGRPPTVREIAARFRMASTFGVRRHLEALEKKGYITRSFNSSRGIELSRELREATGVPIVGRVAAGEPITAIENLDGYLSIESFFPNGEGLFCLRVEGDSMIDEGVWDGDFVIVRQKGAFENGELGVAIVDGEATVKKLRRRRGKVELIPANEQYDVLTVDPAETEFRYAGQVVGVLRTLNSKCGRR